MPSRLPMLLLGATLLFAGGCKRREGDLPCAPDALQFPRGASRVAQPAGVVDDVRLAAVGSAFAVVWASGPSADETDLHARVMGIDGVAASAEIRLTQAAGKSTAVRLQPGPGGLGMSWTDGRFTQQTALATVLTSLSPAGIPAVFQSPVVAADQAPVPAIAVSGSGFLVAWNGRGSDGNEHLFVQPMDAEGNAVGAPVALVPTQADRASRPSAATVGSSGAVVIVDEELRVGVPDPDVFGYLVAGTATLAAVRYGANSDARAPEAVGAGPVGGVVWRDLRDGGRGDLWFAEIGGGEIRLTEGPDEHARPAVASLGASFLLTWIANGDEVRVRAFKSDGRPDGPLLLPGEGLRSDVAWNGTGAGLAWIGADGAVWFRALVCQ